MAITFPTTAELTSRLDEVEARLPAFPARIFRLQRAIAAANYDRTVAAFEAWTKATSRVLRHRQDLRQDRHRPGSRRRRATSSPASAPVPAPSPARPRRRASKVSEAAQTEATKLVDSAIDAVEDDVDDAIDAVEDVDDKPGSGTPVRAVDQGRARRAGQGAERSSAPRA